MDDPYPVMHFKVEGNDILFRNDIFFFCYNYFTVDFFPNFTCLGVVKWVLKLIFSKSFKKFQFDIFFISDAKIEILTLK